MSHLGVIYTSDDAKPLDDAAAQVALLERLRTIVGDELAEGWSVAACAPADGEAGSWRMTLQHDADHAFWTVREKLTETTDTQLRLCLDEEPVQSESPLPSEPETPPITSLLIDLPHDVPSILVGSETAQRRRAAIYGVLLGIALSVGIGVLSPSWSSIRQMFNPRTPSAAVPTAILCLFCWGILHGLNRLRRLRASERLDNPALLSDILAVLRTHGVKELNQGLTGDVVQHGPLLRRIRIALEQWLLRPSLENASLAIEQQIVSDREATQRGYSLLRIFVWATPVLGLIGTVVGISIAVGGFARFLSTDVEDVAKIKAGLVGVTGGLSFAFLITLEGLLASLILMLFTSSLQTQEERHYAGIERSIAEQFLPELQRVAPEREPDGLAGQPEAWSEAMKEAVRKVMESVDAAGNKMLALWDDKHSTYVSDLKAVNERVENSAQSVAKELEAVSAAMAVQMSQCIGAQRTLLEQMLKGAKQGLESCTAEMNRSTQILVTSLNGAIVETGTHLKSVVAALDEASADHLKAFEIGNAAIASQIAQTAAVQKTLLEQTIESAKQGLESCNAEMNQSTQTVVAALHDTTGVIETHLKSVVGALDEAAASHRAVTQQALADSGQALAGYAAGVTRASETVSDLGKVTRQVLESQAVLQAAMAQLGDSRLANLLADLDSSLKELKPVLSSLSEPFVLQAVPVRGHASSHSEG